MNPPAHQSNAIQPDRVSHADSLRAGQYRLLAGLLAGPPPADVLRTLAALEIRDPGTGDSAMVDAWHELRHAATQASAEGTDDEYHALFIGISRGELMPYASWYLSGFLMSRPLALLRRSLAELGIERPPHVREPEDHVSAVCEAMAILAGSEEVPLDIEGRFFGEHVDRWMPRFFADLRAAPSARFYAAVGALGERFLDLEKAYLGVTRA